MKTNFIYIILFIFPILFLFASSDITADSSKENTGEPVEVTQVITAGSNSLITAELSNAREQILAALNNPNADYKKAAVMLNNGERAILPVNYYLEELTMSHPGSFLLRGAIEAPDGIYIPPELTAVTAPVFLYDPEEPCQLPVLKLYPVTHSQLILAKNSSQEALDMETRSNSEIGMLLEDGSYWSVPLNWDTGNVDLTTPGLYKMIGTPDLPEGITLPEEFASVFCDICIQDNEILSLSPPVFHKFYFYIEWLKDTPDSKLFHFYYAIGDGEWQEDAAGKVMKLDELSCQYFIVYCSRENMILNTPYYFRLAYDGEFSNTVKVIITEDDIEYEFIEGDRDGGDRDEQTPPDLSQIAPESPPANTPSQEGESAQQESSLSSSEERNIPSNERKNPFLWKEYPEPGKNEKPPAQYQCVTGSAISKDIGISLPDGTKASPIVMEEDTENTAVWSGARIQKYRESFQDLPLIFEKNHIRLEVPSDYEAFSHISSGDSLHVEVEALSDDTINISVTLNGTPLAVPIKVTMPWDDASARKELQVKDQDGNLIGYADYLKAEGLITFQLERPGVYTVEKSPKKEPPKPLIKDKVEIPAGFTFENKQPAAGASTQEKLDNPGQITLFVLAFFLISAVVFCYHKIKNRKVA